MKGNPLCVDSVGTATAKRWILVSTSLILVDDFVGFFLVLLKSLYLYYINTLKRFVYFMRHRV
jgi:hypothetical protein